MILQPQTYFTIARQLEDPSDATVYYIQAEVRDGYADTLLATVNLESKGNGRWTKNYQIPADPSGQGRYILITTRVYTDSGYTTLSQSYGAEGREYLVQRLPRAYAGGGGGGGEGLTEKKLRTVLTEALKASEKDETEPDLTPVMNALQGLPGALRKVVESRKETDLSPITSLLAELKTQMEEDDGPDYTDQLDGIVEAAKSHETGRNEQNSRVEEALGAMREASAAMQECVAKMEKDYETWQNQVIAQVTKIIEAITARDGRDQSAAEGFMNFLKGPIPTFPKTRKGSEEPQADPYSRRVAKITAS